MTDQKIEAWKVAYRAALAVMKDRVDARVARDHASAIATIVVSRGHTCADESDPAVVAARAAIWKYMTAEERYAYNRDAALRAAERCEKSGMLKMARFHRNVAAAYEAERATRHERSAK